MCEPKDKKENNPMYPDPDYIEVVLPNKMTAIISHNHNGNSSYKSIALMNEKKYVTTDMLLSKEQIEKIISILTSK